jgi:homospermidine synthase
MSDVIAKDSILNCTLNIFAKIKFETKQIKVINPKEIIKSIVENGTIPIPEEKIAKDERKIKPYKTTLYIVK